MDLFADLDPHWAWLTLGLLLAAAEMAVPGIFLIWMAGAALITGLVSWLVPMSLAWQIVLFVELALVSAFLGRRWLRDHPIASADPKLNDRGARLIGETVTVTSAIDAGSGRVRQGDSEWPAKGPDSPPGTRMRITGHEGVVLLVEPLD